MRTVLGVGTQDLEIQPKERTGIGWIETAKVGLASGVIATEGVHGLGLSHRSGAIVWVGVHEGGVGPATVAFVHVHVFTESRTPSAQV